MDEQEIYYDFKKLLYKKELQIYEEILVAYRTCTGIKSDLYIKYLKENIERKKILINKPFKLK